LDWGFGAVYNLKDLWLWIIISLILKLSEDYSNYMDSTVFLGQKLALQASLKRLGLDINSRYDFPPEIKA